MKIIYWRWKKHGSGTPISDSYIQADLGNMFELSDNQWTTHYPLRVLKKEIEVIKIEEIK